MKHFLALFFLLSSQSVDCVKKHPKQLFFNQIEASSALTPIILELSSLNGFTYKQLEQLPNPVVVGPNEELKKKIAREAEALKNETSRSLIQLPIYYYDFARRSPGDTEPVFINLVRDPVHELKRLLLQEVSIKLQKRMDENDPEDAAILIKEYEGCLEEGRASCLRLHPRYSLTSFFCGEKEYCLIHNHHKALKRAKKSIKNNFAVVGVLEDWKRSLYVLENRLPSFFAGASKLGKKREYVPEEEGAELELGPRAKELVKINLKNDIELYNWLRKRLEKQEYRIDHPKEDLSEDVVPA